MSQSYSNVYFAADDVEKTVETLMQKGSGWYNNLYRSGYLDKLKKSWQAYHGNFNGGDSHQITFGGESGELANIAVNHYRSIADTQIVLITSTRPTFQTRSTNTDYKSQVQTTLANALLEYYMREKRLEQYLKRAVTYGVVFGSGYVLLRWNATSGKIYDYSEPDESSIASYNEKGNPLDADGKELKSYPIYEGDVEFVNLSPFDVVFDSTKEDATQHDWVLIRTFKNKYDLAAKYPELEEKILAMRTKSEEQRHRISISPMDDTVDVPVYEFFHKRTESMPDGRYILYLSAECVLMDTVMPYRKLPVYRLSPSEILGTPYGYTNMFDLLPLQDALNSLYSTVLTNQSAFGVQNVLNPRGNDVRVNQISGGLNFIEYNPIVAGGAPGKPESMNLTNTPEEIFGFMKILEGSMEKLSAMNSVVRGDPSASLKSGTALALVQSQALQFISGLQQSYIMMIEDVGTGLIELLQDFASVPRVAEIAGLSNKSKMKEFSSKDIDSISRITVDVGNSLSQTTAGRVQMADNLIQMQLVKTPEQYFSVINSGKLEVITEGQQSQLLLVKSENERMTSGEAPVVATPIDSHSLHIREHMNVLADPDMRFDAELRARVVGHIQEHITMLQTTDPNLLALIGEQPLAPPGGMPVAPGTAAPEQPNQGSLGQASELMSNPQAQTTQPSLNIPQPAQPPAPVAGQPTTPQETFAQNTRT